MTTFLLAGRERDADREKLRFSLLNRLFSETKRNVLKSILLMNKQINLIINGKGGVGKSFFATNFVQYLKDCGIAHCAIDSDHENAILKRLIAVATPRCRKDIELSSFGLPRRAAPLFENFKDFAPPFQRCSHRGLSSLRRTSASSAAPFIPTTRDHCGVLRIPYVLATLRVNRFPILWLRARCKCIARFAGFRLDTYSLRRDEVAS